MSYASPYKGTGHGGYIHTTSYARVHTFGGAGGGVMAQAPTASMSSVNRGGSSSGGGASSGGGSVRGASRASLPAQTTIHTAAASVRGGVTTQETGHTHHGTIHRGVGGGIQPPENPWTCGCVDEDGDLVCDICGCDLRFTDSDGNCECVDDPYGPGYCWCPIGDGWSVWLFMTIIAAAYAHYSVRARKQNTICKS